MVLAGEDIWTVVGGVGSFLLLVFASWCVGEGGEILGKKYDASVIGGLVIAWLNTAPETIFFITALQDGKPSFAVGAVSGSTITVCTVALGACLYIGASARRNGEILLQPAVKRQCTLLGLSLLIPLSVILLQFNQASGICGFAFYLGFLVYSLRNKTSADNDKQVDDIETGHEEPEEDEGEASIGKGIGFLVVGGLLIFLFSGPFISSVVAVAETLEVSPTLLAFFLAPVASEAPEILESISLSRKGNMQNINIAFSNLVGGTITKTTMLCGLFCFFGVAKEFIWVYPNYTISMGMLAFSAGVVAAIGTLFTKHTKWHGAVLLGVFFLMGFIQYYFNAAPLTLPEEQDPVAPGEFAEGVAR